jgi:hypothetical protein
MKRKEGISAQSGQSAWKPVGELMRADAKVIDTLNLALKSELTPIPKASGRSLHPDAAMELIGLD